MSNATAIPSQCQPWCTEHRTGTHPEDGHCRRTTPVGAALTWTSDEGPILWTRAGDDLTPDEAEAYFRAGLDLVATARTAVAA